MDAGEASITAVETRLGPWEMTMFLGTTHEVQSGLGLRDDSGLKAQSTKALSSWACVSESVFS